MGWIICVWLPIVRGERYSRATPGRYNVKVTSELPEGRQESTLVNFTYGFVLFFASGDGSTRDREALTARHTIGGALWGKALWGRCNIGTIEGGIPHTGLCELISIIVSACQKLAESGGRCNGIDACAERGHHDHGYDKGNQSKPLLFFKSHISLR